MSSSEPDAKPAESSASPAAPAVAAKPARPNIVWRFLKWMWRIIDGKVFPGPFGRTMVALVMLAFGVAGSEGYQYVRDHFIDPDEAVKALAKDQKVAFDKLDAQIGSLRGAVDGNGKAVLSSIENTVAELKKTNAALVSRLAQEGSRSPGAGAPDAAASGIYQGDLVTVRESGSIVIDASTSIGIQSIDTRTVVVRVSSLVEPHNSGKRLDIGEAVSYRRGDGQSCMTTLISISEEQGASMRTACAAQ